MADEWKFTTVSAKVVFTLGYKAPGYRVRKEDIEYMLYECLSDLIDNKGFEPIENEVMHAFQVPTTVTIEVA